MVDVASKEMSVKDVLVVGFGAVGSIYALKLDKSGLARVTVVARSNYDILKKDGMNFKSKRYGDIKGWKPHRLCKSVEEAADQAYSYVVITTKSLPEVNPTSGILRPFLESGYPHPQPTYVFIQNGLGVEKDLYNALIQLNKGVPRIINSCLFIYTNLVAENTVEHSGMDRLVIGMYKPEAKSYSSYEDGELEQLTDFSKMLKIEGSTTEIVPDVQCAKFRKSFWNLAFSSISTLTRHPVAVIFQNPEIEEVVVPQVRALLEEFLTVVRAAGYSEDALSSSVIDECIGSTQELHRDPNMRHKASMLVDLEMNRPIEVEVIVGELARTARKFKVDTPRIDLLYALLFIIQKQLI